MARKSQPAAADVAALTLTPAEAQAAAAALVAEHAAKPKRTPKPKPAAAPVVVAEAPKPADKPKRERKPKPAAAPVVAEAPKPAAEAPKPEAVKAETPAAEAKPAKPAALRLDPSLAVTFKHNGQTYTTADVAHLVGLHNHAAELAVAAAKRKAEAAKKAAAEARDAAKLRSAADKAADVLRRANDRALTIMLANDPLQAVKLVDGAAAAADTAAERKAVKLMAERAEHEDAWIAAYMSAFESLVADGRIHSLTPAEANKYKSGQPAVVAARKQLAAIDRKLDAEADEDGRTFRLVARLVNQKARQAAKPAATPKPAAA